MNKPPFSGGARGGGETLSQNHNYDKYGCLFTALPMFVVMRGRCEVAINGRRQHDPVETKKTSYTERGRVNLDMVSLDHPGFPLNGVP